MSDWNGIEEFVAVATVGSFKGGAQALHVSASHISRAILALEQRVQAQLFHRTTRTMRLTDAGRVFLEHCARMTQERDEAIAMINELSEPQGELRVTCSTAMGERFVVPILQRFMFEHPKLTVSIELSNHLVDIVAEGFDLAVRTGKITDSRLLRTCVASRSLYTCAAPDYLKSSPQLKNVGDLDRHACISGTNGTWHFRTGQKDQLYHPKGRFRCNNGHAVINACVAGMGVCQLPEFYILPYLKSGRVVLVLENFQPNDEPIWAVYPERRHHLPKITRVIERLHEELEQAMH